MATPAEIEAAIANAAAKGISSVTSDGQTATRMSADDQIRLADRAAAKEVVTDANAWGVVGRARVMPNWNE